MPTLELNGTSRARINYNLIQRKVNTPLRSALAAPGTHLEGKRMRARLLTHVDGAGERLAFSQHGEPVAQVRHVVLRLQFVSVERFVTLMHTNISYLDPPNTRLFATYLEGLGRIESRY